MAKDRTLDAPHRQRNGPPRVVERAGVAGWRAGAWAMSRIPSRAAEKMLGGAFHVSYHLWPRKRRWSNLNFAHVLGRDPSDPEVRRLARAAYRAYGHYLTELMRLPSLDADEAESLVDSRTLDPLEAYWKESRGVIVTTGHVGNLEAIARGIAHRGWPISAIADDTSFPELFEYLRRQRAGWGVRLIPWRNLREMYGVLRRREVLALIVDWGFRPDGVPVRLFGEWTTLPAGPALLAAKSGAAIVPVGVRREADRRFHVSWFDLFTVPADEPADILRATQGVADGLERAITAAPDQWYSFKPIWPMSDEEKAALASRAAAMLRGAA